MHGDEFEDEYVEYEGREEIDVSEDERRDEIDYGLIRGDNLPTAPVTGFTRNARVSRRRTSIHPEGTGAHFANVETLLLGLSPQVRAFGGLDSTIYRLTDWLSGEEGRANVLMLAGHGGKLSLRAKPMPHFEPEIEEEGGHV